MSLQPHVSYDALNYYFVNVMAHASLIQAGIDDAHRIAMHGSLLSDLIKVDGMVTSMLSKLNRDACFMDDQEEDEEDEETDADKRLGMKLLAEQWAGWE